MIPAATDALCWRGSVRLGRAGVGVEVMTSPAYRELVVFTPANRQAVCLEPYTCTSDAIRYGSKFGSSSLTMMPGPLVPDMRAIWTNERSRNVSTCARMVRAATLCHRW